MGKTEYQKLWKKYKRGNISARGIPEVKKGEWSRRNIWSNSNVEHPGLQQTGHEQRSLVCR